MRIFGLITIFVGLAIAFGYPSFHAGFSNFEIGKYTIFEEQTGFEDQTIWLTPEDMPIEITFSAIADAKAAIFVEIKDGENIVRSDTVEFLVLSNNESGSPEAASMTAKLESFALSDGALYAFSFKDMSLPGVVVSNVTMTVTGIVTPPSKNIPTVGYVLIGFGALLYLVGGRRKSKKVGNAPSGKKSKTSQIGRRAEPAPTKAKKPEESKHKWGRGSGD